MAPARLARGSLRGLLLWPGLQQQVIFVDVHFHWNRLKVQIGAKRQVNTCAELLIESLHNVFLQGGQVFLFKLCQGGL